MHIVWGRRLLLALCSLFLSTAALSAEADLSEAKVKAAFLYKFTGYVTWPASAFEQVDSPFVISVVEADDLAAELSRLVVGRTVASRPVVVRRLGGGDSAIGCHVLFVGSAASGRLGRFLADARALPVLTVTEVEEPLAIASVINFVLVDEQVRFDVSIPAAERGNLKISSRLLSVARHVATSP